MDEVWFIPTGNPPHKRTEGISPGETRAEMLELATAGTPYFAVSRMELAREGKTFTVDTLTELHEEDPSRELFFLIGADSLTDLPTWREPARILELATIVAVNRGDAPPPDLAPLTDHLGPSAAARVQLVTMPGIDLSSTNLRHRIRQGKTIRFTTPKPVEAYIAAHKLYVQ